MPFKKDNEYRMKQKSECSLSGRIDLRVPTEIEEKIKSIPGWQDLLREVIKAWVNDYD